MNLKKRPATNEDIKWLEPLYESLMRPYVELTHSWDNTLFKKHFNSEKIAILQVNNQDLGALKVEYLDECIYLADLIIASDFQNKGIGSSILKSLIIEAKQKSLPVRLKVLKGNPARNLYERHGFRLIEDQEYSEIFEYREY